MNTEELEKPVRYEPNHRVAREAGYHALLVTLGIAFLMGGIGLFLRTSMIREREASMSREFGTEEERKFYNRKKSWK